MRKTVLGGVFGIAVLAAGAAQAQIVSWEITPEQERSVYTTIYQDRGTVGVAPAREYRYVMHGNRVVFVEPGTRRVIRVIGP